MISVKAAAEISGRSMMLVTGGLSQKHGIRASDAWHMLEAKSAGPMRNSNIAD